MTHAILLATIALFTFMMVFEIVNGLIRISRTGRKFKAMQKEMQTKHIELVSREYYNTQSKETFLTRHNCPNCGAPVTDKKCDYCGTVFIK